MAGRIPKQFIDDVLLRADIVEIIDARVPLKKAGKDYKACCPFHDEKSASFTVSPTKQFYHCFGCGAHGTVIGFLMEYEHMSFPEAVEELANRLGLKLPTESLGPVQRTDATAELLRVLEQAARYYRGQLRESQRAIAYLKDRGIGGEVATAFGIGYAPDGWNNLASGLGLKPTGGEILIQTGLAVRKDDGRCYDRFRDRVMFPIHDYRGRIVGFGGRIIDAAQGSANVAGDRTSEATSGGPKYLNSPETVLFHKGHELYGLYRARDAIRKAGHVVVVEGYMDVVGLVQMGVDSAVATLGTAMTSQHLERLFRFAPEAEVIFCFDGDKAGVEAAWRALDTVLPALHERRKVGFMFLPQGEDPDTLVRKEGKEAFIARVREATTIADFLFRRLADQIDMQRSGARVQLAELARPYLDKVPAGLQRDAMLDRLRLSPALHEKLSTGRREGPRATVIGPKPTPPLVRLAVAMLVQHPTLAAQIEDSDSPLGTLELPGAALLRVLVDLLRDKPNLNTAAIAEHFRGSEHEHHIARLATWTHPTLTHDVAAEFQGVLKQMKRATIKTKVESLLQKQKIYGLTDLEMTELTQLTRIQADKPELAY
jgi:DNA primase